MKISKFSPKQLSVLNWWTPKSKHHQSRAIICDGAVRSGKTMALSLSFVFWAFAGFNSQYFALCGRSVKSAKRNIVVPLCDWLSSLGFSTNYNSTNNLLTVKYNNQSNYFYIFGGNNASSSSVIQALLWLAYFLMK